MEIDHAVELLREFIRFDTTNPPGHEEKAILFLEGILNKEGIQSEVFQPVAERANILARIKGKKKGKPVVLLGHVDVVPANADDWDVDPFGGELRDGYIYGRGAVDMKAQTICQLLAFIQLHNEGVVPERDMIFLATCDEEVGGQNGVEYMLNEVEELKSASFVLSEGGCIIEENGHFHAQVSVAEKKLSQFMIKATGIGGHGSMPHKDNANEKIVRASQAILSYEWPFKSTNIVNTYLNGLLKGKKVNGFTFKGLKESLNDKRFKDFIENNPVYNALLRNTVTLTILKGGEKVNVIPGESFAYFDARLLPTEKHEHFFKKINSLGGKDIQIIRIGSGISEPAPSGYNTPFFKGIKGAVKKTKGTIPVLPFVTTGATDLRYFRNLGITAYGFFPATIAVEDILRMHGKNERISIESLQEGLDGTYEIVKFLSTVTSR
ncbi:MAG: M20/M25/M40 family metallo-hydrolase [Proteobacteria bacterium]|nr:M20/M25/M40 family metallo-hydrolase [Pseudomonadota bacterium]